MSVTGGTALFVAAFGSSSTTVSIIVNFEGASGTRLLRDAESDIRRLLRDELCGDRGMLRQYHLKPEHVTLVGYEHMKRVAATSLSSSYCA